MRILREKYFVSFVDDLVFSIFQHDDNYQLLLDVAVVVATVQDECQSIGLTLNFAEGKSEIVLDVFGPGSPPH